MCLFPHPVPCLPFDNLQAEAASITVEVACASLERRCQKLQAELERATSSALEARQAAEGGVERREAESGEGSNCGADAAGDMKRFRNGLISVTFELMDTTANGGGFAVFRAGKR